MKSFSSSIVCLFLQAIALCACRAPSSYNIGPPPIFEIGGGHSNHKQPDYVSKGRPLELRIELTVWGEGSGEMSKRYTDVKCHYKTDAGMEYATISMQKEYEDADKIGFLCSIPADGINDGNTLLYYFDMLFDGHYNKDPEIEVPIK